MKVAIYAICKNEEKHADRFMESVQDADFISIADTGSTDHTVEQLHTKAITLGKSRQFATHNISVNPWRFDSARNTALALVPSDIDVCIRLDLDEVLNPGWRDALEQTWIPGVTTQLWYDFHHAPGYSFHANYIHARHGFVWRGMDHEGLYTADGRPSISHYAPKVSITHHQDRSKDRTDILGRLQAAVKEDKRARTVWYLGRELFYYSRWHHCIETMQDYLKQSDATWPSERMDAMCMIAKSYASIDEHENAVAWYFRALGEVYTREPLLGLTQMLSAIGRDQEARHYAHLALTLTNKLTTIHHNPKAWDGTLEKLALQQELTNA